MSELEKIVEEGGQIGKNVESFVLLLLLHLEARIAALEPKPADKTAQ